MNITVTKEDIKDYFDIHGGECAKVSLEITVDPSLEPRVQRNLVMHAVVENFCMTWTHEKVEELIDFLEDALDQLD